MSNRGHGAEKSPRTRLRGDWFSVKVSGHPKLIVVGQSILFQVSPYGSVGLIFGEEG